MRDAARIFDAHAADYDALRRRLVPCFDDFYGAALEGVGLLGREPAEYVVARDAPTEDSVEVPWAG